jgi:hypothetical protein
MADNSLSPGKDNDAGHSALTSKQGSVVARPGAAQNLSKPDYTIDSSDADVSDDYDPEFMDEVVEVLVKDPATGTRRPDA